MKIKPIPFSEVKAAAFKDPQVLAAYNELKKEEELQEMLKEIRVKAGLTSTQVAQKMGISQPAVSRLERNVTKASLNSLERYARACGTTLKISPVF